jgi:hypothetical protein
MERRSLETWATQERGLYVARNVISKLENAGVRSLPVKGVLLARLVYDTADRPIADVDLIIERPNLERAVGVAKTAGWRTIWDSKALGNVNFVVDDIAIDVACSMGPAGVSAIGSTALFERATRSERPLGFPHWLIEVHDHALLVAIDAFKDKLGRGKPWAREDLVRIVKLEGFSAEALVERAASARLGTMLAIVSDWIVSVAPNPAWSEIRERLTRRPLRTRYLARYARALERKGASAWQRWYLSALTRAVSDSPARRAAALVLGAVGTARFVARHGGLDVNVWNDEQPPTP